MTGQERKFQLLENGAKLQLTYVDAADSAEFSCTAENLAGKRQFYKEVSVRNQGKQTEASF
jgi:hypothetical protein